MIAISAISLFAFFSYVRGMRYKIDKQSSHPHPIVRAYYLKDMLYAIASKRWPLDMSVLQRLTDEKLDEILIALAHVGLFDGKIHSDKYIDTIELERERMEQIQARYRSSSSQWSWISWHGI